MTAATDRVVLLEKDYVMESTDSHQLYMFLAIEEVVSLRISKWKS
jgi:hypothetical protein